MILDQDKLIYLYCVTVGVPFLEDPFSISDISFIEHCGLFVTVKYVSEDDFSEANIKKNISNEPWLDAHAREHLSVIGEIMKRNTVIPFNFGTIYRSFESVCDFLEKYFIELTDSLSFFENKEEWSVKIFCNKKCIIQNIGSLSKNISDIELQIKNSSPGKAYLLGKKKNEILEKEISQIYNSYSKELFSALNCFSEEYTLNVLLSNDLTGRDEDMIVNSTMLISKENISDFIIKSDELVTEYDHIGLFLEVTGPWPPYTFLKLSS